MKALSRATTKKLFSRHKHLDVYHENATKFYPNTSTSTRASLQIFKHTLHSRVTNYVTQAVKLMLYQLFTIT